MKSCSKMETATTKKIMQESHLTCDIRVLNPTKFGPYYSGPAKCTNQLVGIKLIKIKYKFYRTYNQIKSLPS